MKIVRTKDGTGKGPRIPVYILIYEFILGIVELLGGLALAFFGPQIFRFYQLRLIQELSEDPRDILVRITESVVPGLLTHNAFIIFYLIALGLVKIASTIGLVYQQNWAVDLLVGLIVVSAPFQLYELITHSHFLGWLYLFGSLLIALYLVEFRPAAWVSKMLIWIFHKKTKAP